MINTQSFVLYESVYKHIQTLEKKVSAETALKYANAIMEFGLYGIVPNENDDVWIYGFEQAMTSIYSSKEKYNKSVENGKKGGAPRKYDHDLIVELKRQGLTNKQVAEELGCSEITVSRALKEKREETESEEQHNNINDKSKYNLNDTDNLKEKDNENQNDTYTLNDTFNDTANEKAKEKNIYSDYL